MDKSQADVPFVNQNLENASADRTTTPAPTLTTQAPMEMAFGEIDRKGPLAKGSIIFSFGILKY
jgi:hypothetical protein